jgi:hypothetical protein
MFDRRGAEGVSSGVEGPVVVIRGDLLEGEVVYAVRSEDGRKASFGVAGCVNRGREGRREVLGRARELQF